ncbi:hypothetical protein GCM10023085_55560 [Actinomadura viridis]|uniref:Uncharacterized protein n=1 Tax=Actinomadura viridis TaxID=58110 RepID=A0A931DGW2_9ACTN|nr:hypothetical protein [Actinomadura viridis]MBG6086513.1 hypothetical protein [Actinomadura viridis]
MADRTTQTNRLAALGAHLSARGYEVDLIDQGLRVVNTQVTPHTTITITCCPRPEDGGRGWFFTASGDPVAEAGRIIDAGVDIMGRLADRDHHSGEAAR